MKHIKCKNPSSEIKIEHLFLPSPTKTKIVGSTVKIECCMSIVITTFFKLDINGCYFKVRSRMCDEFKIK